MPPREGGLAGIPGRLGADEPDPPGVPWNTVVPLPDSVLPRSLFAKSPAPPAALPPAKGELILGPSRPVDKLPGVILPGSCVMLP